LRSAFVHELAILSAPEDLLAQAVIVPVLALALTPSPISEAMAKTETSPMAYVRGCRI